MKGRGVKYKSHFPIPLTHAQFHFPNEEIGKFQFPFYLFTSCFCFDVNRKYHILKGRASKPYWGGRSLEFKRNLKTLHVLPKSFSIVSNI